MFCSNMFLKYYYSYKILNIKLLTLSMLSLFLLYNYGHSYSFAQSGTVISSQKISNIEGDFPGILDDIDHFGHSISLINDLDADGINDIAVGVPFDDDGGLERGAVWILFLNKDGTVKSSQKISDTQGNFVGILDDWDTFGASVASLCDLNGDSVSDIIVGSQNDSDGGYRRGATYVLFLNQDGTVKLHQKISNIEGNFTGTLDDNDRFGTSVTSLGDIDGDGVGDIVVGARNDGDGGFAKGAVWVLFLNQDGTVKAHQKISDTQGNFAGILKSGDFFGSAVNSLGDLDGDGVTDIAVGSRDDDGGIDRGAVWILFLNQNGTVKAHQKISDTQGNFAGILHDRDFFGTSITTLSDLDSDGITDIVVGAWLDDDGGLDRGAVWILFLNQDGTVKLHQKISDVEGNFLGVLDDSDNFGISLASIGDLNGDGFIDIAVGARQDNDGGIGRGAVWILFLEGMLPPTTNIPIDIKPGSCPNVLNVKSNGKLKVTILGTVDFDVRTVDIATLNINGIAPIKSDFEDVSTPEPCDCIDLDGNSDDESVDHSSDDHGDSFEDLVLKFERQDILAKLGGVQDGEIIQLNLTGNLLESEGGKAIEGTDCILIKNIRQSGFN